MSIFVKYGDIQGQAEDSGHKNWMKVESMEWGINRSVASDTAIRGGREVGSVTSSDIKIVRRADRATPKLVMEATLGDGTDVEIHVTQRGKGAGEETYLKYTLQNAIISGYFTAADQDQKPVEHIVISFTQFTVEFTPYDENGNPEAPELIGFDLATNDKV